jgi:hypothetical protein
MTLESVRLIVADKSGERAMATTDDGVSVPLSPLLPPVVYVLAPDGEDRWFPRRIGASVMYRSDAAWKRIDLETKERRR